MLPRADCRPRPSQLGRIGDKLSAVTCHHFVPDSIDANCRARSVADAKPKTQPDPSVSFPDP